MTAVSEDSENPDPRKQIPYHIARLRSEDAPTRRLALGALHVLLCPELKKYIGPLCAALEKETDEWNLGIGYRTLFVIGMHRKKIAQLFTKGLSPNASIPLSKACLSHVLHEVMIHGSGKLKKELLSRVNSCAPLLRKNNPRIEFGLYCILLLLQQDQQDDGLKHITLNSWMKEIQELLSTEKDPRRINYLEMMEGVLKNHDARESMNAYQMLLGKSDGPQEGIAANIFIILQEELSNPRSGDEVIAKLIEEGNTTIMVDDCITTHHASLYQKLARSLRTKGIDIAFGFGISAGKNGKPSDECDTPQESARQNILDFQKALSGCEFFYFSPSKKKGLEGELVLDEQKKNIRIFRESHPGTILVIFRYPYAEFGFEHQHASDESSLTEELERDMGHIATVLVEDIESPAEILDLLEIQHNPHQKNTLDVMLSSPKRSSIGVALKESLIRQIAKKTENLSKSFDAVIGVIEKNDDDDDDDRDFTTTPLPRIPKEDPFPALSL